MDSVRKRLLYVIAANVLSGWLRLHWPACKPTNLTDKVRLAPKDRVLPWFLAPKKNMRIP